MKRQVAFEDDEVKSERKSKNQAIVCPDKVHCVCVCVCVCVCISMLYSQV